MDSVSCGDHPSILNPCFALKPSFPRRPAIPFSPRARAYRGLRRRRYACGARPRAARAAAGADLDPGAVAGIAGAGRVRLMLTLSGSEKTLYQTDSRTVTSAGSTTTQTETVFRQTGSSEKEPAAQSVLYPQYQGALVVCDGADSASVRLAIIQAVSSLTGLGSNKIAVVKMKGQ